MRRFPQPHINNQTSKPDFEDLIKKKNLTFTTAVSVGSIERTRKVLKLKLHKGRLVVGKQTSR